MSYPNLNLLLQAANRRQLFVGLVRVGCLALSGLVIGGLVAVALDAIFAFPVGILWFVDAVLVAITMWGLAGLFCVVRRASFDARRIARLLEQQLGMTSNALINAVDLRGPQSATVSRRLVDESVQLGEAAARRVDLRRAIPGRPARQAAVGAGWVLLGVGWAYWVMPGVFSRGLPRLFDPAANHPPFTWVHFDVGVQPEPLPYGASANITARLSGPVAPDRADVVFADAAELQRLPMIAGDDGYRLHLPRVEEPREFFIDTPKGRSDWYRMDVQQVPLCEEIWVSYDYPSHTDWAPRRHRLVGRDIEGLVGTRITLEATSNFPLAAANVEIFGDNPSAPAREKLQLLPTSDDPHRVQGELLLRQSGRLTLQLVGNNQVAGPELREARLIALADRPPQVAITEPESIALAVEDWKIPLAVQATDDIEVTHLELEYQRQGDALQVLPLETKTIDRRHAQGQGELDLAKLGARAGDEIRLYASAQDNHPPGVQTSDSPTHVIQVISSEQYLEYLRATYEMEQLAAEISQLNTRLSELAQQRQQMRQRAETLEPVFESGQPLEDEQLTQLDQSLQSLDEYSQQLEDVSEQLRERLDKPQLYDAERAYRESLQRLADQLGRQQETTRELRQALEPIAQGATPQSEDWQRLQRALQQLEQTSEPFSDATSDQLSASQRQAEQLAQAQKLMSEGERIQQVVQQQRDLAERLQTLENEVLPSMSESRRAGQMARDQEQLNQQLQEAKQSLREAAEQAAGDLPQTSSDACQLCDSIDRQGIPKDQQQAARAVRQGKFAEAVRAAQNAADKLESLADQGPQRKGVGQEIRDGNVGRGLRLSVDDIQRTLQQMAQGQPPSPFGPRPADPRRPFSGSMSRFGLHGPQPPREAFAARRGGPSHDAGGERSAAFDQDGDGEAELIEAISREFDIGTAGNMRGVPVGYRDQAEAYFRRMAEELTTEAGDH